MTFVQNPFEITELFGHGMKVGTEMVEVLLYAVNCMTAVEAICITEIHAK